MRIGLACTIEDVLGPLLHWTMDDHRPLDTELETYAAGRLGWSVLRRRGVNYADVLAGLGRLGLRPPIAPMSGPNVAARQRGIALLKSLLGPPKQ